LSVKVLGDATIERMSNDAGDCTVMLPVPPLVVLSVQERAITEPVRPREGDGPAGPPVVSR
jgi:hypothetical protein